MWFQYLFVTLGILLSLNSHALTLPLPRLGDDIIGAIQTVVAQPGDTLAKIGERYEIGAQEMREANYHDYPKGRIKAGDKIIVPTQFILPPIREGIVINLPELRLYYFPPDSQEVVTFPVAIGRVNWQTPIMLTHVVAKQKDPVWIVPKSIKEYTLRTKGRLLPDIMPAGPHNPLGKYKLQLAAPGYLIHGTNEPSSIGNRVSSGCIRMPAQGIEILYNEVAIETPVYILNNPIKAGWLDKQLYIEVQWPLNDYPAISDEKGTSLKAVVDKALTGHTATIDWEHAEQIVNERLGVPRLITK